MYLWVYKNHNKTASIAICLNDLKDELVTQAWKSAKKVDLIIDRSQENVDRSFSRLTRSTSRKMLVQSDFKTLRDFLNF